MPASPRRNLWQVRGENPRGNISKNVTSCKKVLQQLGKTITLTVRRRTARRERDAGRLDSPADEGDYCPGSAAVSSISARYTQLKLVLKLLITGAAVHQEHVQLSLRAHGDDKRRVSRVPSETGRRSCLPPPWRTTRTTRRRAE